MSVTVEDIEEYLGLAPGEPMAELIYEVSTARVRDFLRPQGVRRCPEAVQDLAIRYASRTAYQHWQSQTGVMEFEGAGEVSYIRADILAGPARSLLIMYRGLPEVG